MLRGASCDQIAGEVARRAKLPRVVRPNGPRLSLNDQRYFANLTIGLPRQSTLAACPRCDAVGLIYNQTGDDDACVEWRRGNERWYDGPSSRELRYEQSGCGYDDAPKRVLVVAKSVRARLEHACRTESNETFPERHDGMRVEMELGDLRALLALLDAARACEGYITTHGEQHLTDDLSDALVDCDKET